MGVAVSVSSSQLANASSAGITINLSASLVVGFPTFVVVYSSTANPHVWPAGWVVLYAVACDGGYFSVGRRAKVLGDATTVAVTNGGVAANWRTSYSGFKSSNPAATSIAIASSTGFVTASGTPVPVPALADSPDEWLLLLCSSNAGSAFASPYPLATVVGNDGTEPPILQWPRRASGGSPALTLARGVAATTGVFAALLTDGGGPVATTGTLDDYAAERVDQRGYNGYAPTNESWGGSISVV